LLTGEEAFNPYSRLLTTTPFAVMQDGQPLRPLSAYNYFFREERYRILKYGPSYDSNILLHSNHIQLYSIEHENSLHRCYWNQDHTMKRKHRKSHGKVSFIDLSKLISKRWKELCEEGKKFYQQVASKDRDRYRKEIAAQSKMNS
jgi:HMG (high mobility group) box